MDPHIQHLQRDSTASQPIAWGTGQQAGAGLDFPKQDIFRLLAFAQAVLRLSKVHFEAGIGPASLRTHYVGSQSLSSSFMDGTRLYFPVSITAWCLHRRRDDQQGGVVSLLLGLFISIHSTYPSPAPSRGGQSQGSKGHLNHSMEVSLSLQARSTLQGSPVAVATLLLDPMASSTGCIKHLSY